jgi:hypothetical protein
MNETFGDALSWSEKQFGEMDLGDRRRTKRGVLIGAALAKARGGTLPPAFKTKAELKAAYAFFETKAIRYQAILRPHLKATRRACREAGMYLLIEDTTDLDFTRKAASIQGLGYIGNGGGRGLFTHTTLAVQVEDWKDTGEPVLRVAGLFDQVCWARKETGRTARESRSDRWKRPRESARWAQAFEAMDAPPPDAQWVAAMDREGDIYEAFLKCLDHEVDFIIRAKEPRALSDEDQSLFEKVSSGPVRGTYEVTMKGRPGVPKRTAHLEVRACAATLRPPYRPGWKLEPLTLNIVEVREACPPAGVEPLRWLLLTTLPIDTWEAIRKIPKLYAVRWLVEEFHKILKTGLGIEESQLEKAEEIQKLLAFLSLIGVRLLELKLDAAYHPQERVNRKWVNPVMLAVLTAFFGSPKEGWTNAALLVNIARLGGFLARKSDGHPGWLTLWRGWQKLMLLTDGYRLAKGGD